MSNFWSKFASNSMALLGLIYIILICFMAIFGYIIAPDNTSNANQQFLEISARKLGTEIIFLKIEDQKKIKQSLISTFLHGKISNDILIPLDSFNIVGYSLIAYPIDKSKTIGNRFIFTAEQVKINKHCSLQEFSQQVEKKCIIKRKFLLGTDKMGRDYLSRLIIGARVSLAVGMVAVIISLVIGIILGSLAGYYKGWLDSFIMWIINVSWSIPTLLLVLALTLIIKKGIFQIFIAIGLTMWVDVARIIRGQVLSIREKEYIEACRSMGFGDFRIIWRHILPATIGPLVIISASNFAAAILIESGLSFLGLGVQPPVPTWGSMIKEHYGYIILNKSYLAILPGVAIMFLTLAFTFVGNGLRDAFDTKTTLTKAGIA